jgi:PKD repeat protein
MKKICCLIAFVLLSTITANLDAQSLIHSTPSGGNWNDINTWVEHIIPGASDTVIICGTVTISSSPVSCFDLEINPGCTLQNSGGLKILNVLGSVTNNGSLLNPSTQLNVYINGNIENNGVWHLNLTHLGGAGDQSISCSEGHYFECTDFKSSKPGGSVIVNSDLVFNNSKIDFSYNNLVLDSGFSLTINGQYLRNINIASTGGTLNSGMNAYCQGVTASNLVLEGTFLTGSSTNILTGNITNDGVIGNYGTSHDLIIQGSLVNNGTLTDISNNLTLYLSGDLYNDGEIANYRIFLNGASEQHISASDGKLITSDYLTATGSKTLYIDSDLFLYDCTVDLGNNHVFLNPDITFSLSFQSSLYKYFRAAIIHCNNGMIHMTGGGYINDLTIIDPKLAGIIQVGDHDCVFTGTTTNLGTLQNYGTSNHILNINGDVVNNGWITNGTGTLEINVTGNIINNYIWENNKMNLIGTEVQQISQAPDVFFSIPTINAQSCISGTDLTFVNSQITFSNHNLTMLTGKILSVTGNTAYLKQVNLFANHSQLYMNGGAYLTAANIHDTELSGRIILRSSDVNFYGATSLSGTIENSGINHYTYLFGSFTNQGNITDGENQLTLHIQENLTNDSTWVNYQTILDGDNDQFIYLEDDTEIAGTVLLDAKGGNPWQWYKDGNILPGCTQRYLTFNGISAENYGSYFCTIAGGTSRNFLICRATEAQFITGIQSGCHPLVVQFTDESVSHFGITSWFWDFGDGFTSDEQNPRHNYALPGVYSVSLTISDSYNTSTITVGDYITVYQTPSADFDFSNVTIGDPVHFTDMSSQIQRQIIYQTLWAHHVIAFSSRYTSPEIPEWWWSEEQALGEPDVYPNYGDSVKAWAPLTANRQREFIELGYETAMKINRVTVYETMKPGTVDTVYVKNPDGDWVIVWSGTAMPQPDEARAFEIEFPLTEFDVSDIRIAMNSPAIPYWNEIDAVSVSSPIDTIINPLTQYYWDMDDGNFYSTPDDPTHLYDQPGMYDVSLTITNPGGCEDLISKTVTVYEPGLVPVCLRAYLQGPFADTGMTVDLNAGDFLPLAQPYSNPPWNYTGNEAVASIPDADIVDWILVDIRKSTGGPETAISDSVIARVAGFIRMDGHITGTDGNTPLMASLSDTMNIYPVVMHRNHLGIISSVSMNRINGRFEYDFTSGEGKAWGAGSQIPVGENKFAMVAGDLDSDGLIDAADLNLWKSQAGVSGYTQGDVNLDGQVMNAGKNDFIIPNSGRESYIPD